jgi:hypothetical protein
MKSKRPPRLVFGLAFASVLMPLWIPYVMAGGLGAVAIAGVFAVGYLFSVIKWAEYAPRTGAEANEDRTAALMHDHRDNF